MVIETNMFVNWLIYQRVVISYFIRGAFCIFISKTSYTQSDEEILIKYVHFNALALCIPSIWKFCVNFCDSQPLLILYFKLKGSLYLFKIKVALGKMIAEIILLMLRIFHSTGYGVYLIRLVRSTKSHSFTTKFIIGWIAFSTW